MRANYLLQGVGQTTRRGMNYYQLFPHTYSNLGQPGMATRAPRHLQPQRRAITTGSQAVRLAGVRRGARRRQTCPYPVQPFTKADSTLVRSTG